jgi:Helix-turn-helix domain
MNQPNSMLNEHDAAKWLGVDVTTLRGWRAKKVGPVYAKYLDRSIRYPVSELMKFAEQSLVKTGVQ